MTAINSRQSKLWHGRLMLFALFLLAFGLRWYYVSSAVVLSPVRGDAIQYYSYALNLANHGVFSKDLPGAAFIHPDNYRDPGYPSVLSLWMKMLGAGAAWYAAVLLAQAMLGAFTVLLAVQLGKHWLSLRWAGTAGVLMAVWPHSITINGYLLSETLFSFLVALGMVVVASAMQQRDPRRALLAGLILGAAALTNAILLPFGMLLAALLAWQKLASRTLCLALAFGAFALPGAWAIRNAAVVSTSGDSSSMDRGLQNFVQGSWPSFQSDWRNSIFGDQATQASARIALKAVDAEDHLLKTLPLLGAEAVAGRLAKHPLQFIRWYLIEKPALLWGWNIEISQGDIFVYPTRDAPFQIQPAWIALESICRALNTELMLLASLSVIFAWQQKGDFATFERRQSRGMLIIVISLIVFTTLVYSILQAEPRYSIPFRPFEILLAVTTLSGTITWWRHRSTS
jgi:hypothetical protein